jgi:DnaJ family protein C protein 10
MLDFVMRRIKGKVSALRGGAALDKIVGASDDHKTKPWLLDLCSSNHDCLSSLTRKKVAAILDGLAYVAYLDCSTEKELCKRLGVSSGVRYFPTGSDLLLSSAESPKTNAKILDSYDARELGFAVLELLPDFEELSEAKFQKLRKDDGASSELGWQNWLIEFTDGSAERNFELRKLPALIRNVKVGRFNCRKYAGPCRQLHIQKFPTFAVFKSDHAYEIHHGRPDAHDIAGFVKESLSSPLRVLNAEDFQKAIRARSDKWFIDFFTPWCPPCMRLLPIFRQAARMAGDSVRFGSIDCTIHGSVCQSAGVRSYPTTIFYNHTEPHPFVGLHSLEQILDFAEDIQNPPVVTLTPDTFASSVTQRAKNISWVVDFYAPWCGPCQQLAPEMRKVAKDLRSVPGVYVGQVDCEQHKSFCRSNSIGSYPTIRMYPAENKQTVDYSNWWRDAFNIKAWVQEHLPSVLEVLTGEVFLDRVLEDRVPWLVDFYAPWCGHCHSFAPVFEEVARRFQKHRSGIKFGKLDCDAHTFACRQAGISAYPMVRFYGGTKEAGFAQDSYGLSIEAHTAGQIEQILRQQLGEDGEVQDGTFHETQEAEHPFEVDDEQEMSFFTYHDEF